MKLFKNEDAPSEKERLNNITEAFELDQMLTEDKIHSLNKDISLPLNDEGSCYIFLENMKNEENFISIDINSNSNFLTKQTYTVKDFSFHDRPTDTGVIDSEEAFRKPINFKNMNVEVTFRMNVEDIGNYKKSVNIDIDQVTIKTGNLNDWVSENILTVLEVQKPFTTLNETE